MDLKSKTIAVMAILLVLEIVSKFVPAVGNFTDSVRDLLMPQTQIEKALDKGVSW